MKRQLQPLLLCFFIVFFSLNLSAKENKLLLQRNNYLTDFVNIPVNSENHLISNSNYFKNNFLNNNFFKNNNLFQYYSNYSVNGGVSLKREFSYKIIGNYDTSVGNITPTHIQGNLFGQGMFYGFALTVALLCLVCYFLFEDQLYLIFSATVAALIVAFFFGEELFPLIGINLFFQNNIIMSSILLVTIGLSSLFASKYLLIKEHYPKLNHVTIPLMSVSALLIITSFLLDNILFSKIANALLFGTLTLYFLTGILLFSKNNYSKFYVIATFIPLLFSIDYFVLSPFGIDFLFTKAYHLKIATVFELMILSYAIMYRLQALKEEGELRQTELRIFLKRQDMMNRTKVEQLIEDVYLENLIMHYDLDGLEIKLLQYISEGKENHKIARKLKMTETEVIEHTKELYVKLEINEHIQEDYRMVDSQPDYIYN